jgi:hypothetical protein
MSFAENSAKKFEGATALRPLRPLSIVPLSCLGFPAQSVRETNPVFFLGKRNLKVQLWNPVYACAKGRAKIEIRKSKRA